MNVLTIFNRLWYVFAINTWSISKTLCSNKVTISMWPDVASSSLSVSASRSASMTFQSLIKASKIHPTFSWVPLSVFSWFNFDSFLLTDKRSLMYSSNFCVSFTLWGIGLFVSIFPRISFLIYELICICLNMRLTKLVSSIHFLCFQALTQIFNI